MTQRKILSWPSLKKALSRERKHKKTVVFTNGCFDLIHVGHLKVFEKCKALGDVLVLGLNSDSSVRRLKGPQRPIIKQDDRARLLAGLEPVDYITIFKEDTPAELIRYIAPDILVKGGDWVASAIVGRDMVNKVVRIHLVKGRSTTAIIKAILKKYRNKK